MQYQRISRLLIVPAAAATVLLFQHQASAWGCYPPGYGCPDSSSYGYGGEYLPPARAVIDAPLTRVDNGYWAAFPWNRGRGGPVRRVAANGRRGSPVAYDGAYDYGYANTGYAPAPGWSDGGFASEQNYGYDGPYDESGAYGVMVDTGSAPVRHRAVRRVAAPAAAAIAAPVYYKPTPMRATQAVHRPASNGFHGHDALLDTAAPVNVPPPPMKDGAAPAAKTDAGEGGYGKAPLDLPAPSWVTEGG